MSCVPEPHNIYDRHAMLVMAPALEDIPQELRNMRTRDPPNPQFVRDIAACPIGRVPANLSRVFSRYLTVDHYFTKIEIFIQET